LGSAVSVIGLPAAVPLGGVGGCFALISSALIIASRKLETKIKKHHEITTLAVSKRDTVNRLFSKALANNDVSSHEFDTILSEFERYNYLKEQVRAKMLRQPSKRKIPEVDVKKMEQDIRGRVEAEMLKKIADAASSNSWGDTSLFAKALESSLLTVSRLETARVVISWCFLIFVSSFRLAIISAEEMRAKHPPTPPNGTAAGRPTTDRAEPKLALENTAETTLEPAALQLTNFFTRLYFFATSR